MREHMWLAKRGSGRVGGRTEEGRVVQDDLDERGAAQREAWKRWGAIEPDVALVMVPIMQIVDAFNAKDLDTWRAGFTEDLIVEDHRHAGFGRIDGAEAYAESIAALWEIAPEPRRKRRTSSVYASPLDH